VLVNLLDLLQLSCTPNNYYNISPAGMILVNTFEETFGDMYGEGVWSKLSKKASSNINRSVVALASFNGMHRFFLLNGMELQLF